MRINSRQLEEKISLPPITSNLVGIVGWRGKTGFSAKKVESLQVKIVKRTFMPQTQRLIARLLSSKDIYGWIERNRYELLIWFTDFITYITSKTQKYAERGKNRTDTSSDPLVEEVIRLIEVVSENGLLHFAAENLDPDYLTDLIGYTGGAVFLVLALYAAEGLAKQHEKFKTLPDRVREALDRVLDKAVMMWSEVEMLKRVKEEDEEEIRKIAASHELGMHE